MNILLDENITDAAIKHLESYGYNVWSIKSLGLSGIGYSDNAVLKTAIEYESILVTHNGRHFIDSIPPCKNLMHFGLLWLETQMTKINSGKYCECLQQVIIQSNLQNTIWKVKFGQGVKMPICQFSRRYP